MVHIQMIYLLSMVNFNTYFGLPCQRREEKRREEKEKQDQRRESQKKEDAGARKGKSRKSLCFPKYLWLWRLQNQAGQMKNCSPLWREAHFEVKSDKTAGFGPLLEVEMSKKCTPLWAHFDVKGRQKMRVSGHFWKLRCRKSGRHRGAKHVSKSNS